MGDDIAGERGEVGGMQRLRPVAASVLGILVDLDEDPIGADGGCGA